MQKYNYLIFDADHTLIDYIADEKDALVRLFSEIGFAVNGDMLARAQYLSEYTWTETGLYDVNDSRIQREYHVLYKTHLDLLFTRIFEEYPCDFSPKRAGELLLKYLEDGTNSIFGAKETLRALKEKGYTVCVATNGLYSIQIGRLKGLMEYVDELFVSETLGVIKPNPIFFEKIFNTLGAKAEQCRMIGDSLSSDVAGAIGVKMDSCWYNSKAKLNGSGFTPTFEIGKLTDLLKIL